MEKSDEQPSPVKPLDGLVRFNLRFGSPDTKQTSDTDTDEDEARQRRIRIQQRRGTSFAPRVTFSDDDDDDDEDNEDDEIDDSSTEQLGLDATNNKNKTGKLPITSSLAKFHPFIKNSGSELVNSKEEESCAKDQSSESQLTETQKKNCENKSLSLDKPIKSEEMSSKMQKLTTMTEPKNEFLASVEEMKDEKNSQTSNLKVHTNDQYNKNKETLKNQDDKKQLTEKISKRVNVEIELNNEAVKVIETPVTKTANVAKDAERHCKTCQ